MFCSNCGNEIKDGESFSIKDGKSFCNNCGAKSQPGTNGNISEEHMSNTKSPQIKSKKVFPKWLLYGGIAIVVLCIIGSMGEDSGVVSETTNNTATQVETKNDNTSTDRLFVSSSKKDIDIIEYTNEDDIIQEGTEQGNTGIDGSFAYSYLSDDCKKVVDYAMSYWEMNYIYNWNYSDRFISDRNKIFEMIEVLHRFDMEHNFVDGDISFDLDTELYMQIDGVVGVALEEQLIGDNYLYIEDNPNERDCFYYGETKNGRPDGMGIVFYYFGVEYGGYFKNGVPTKYGARFSTGTNELVWECTEPKFGNKNNRYQANGDGVLYYYKCSEWYENDGSAVRYLLWDNIMYDLPGYENVLRNSQGIDIKSCSALISEIKLVPQPMVEFEGKIKNAKPTDNGTHYDDIYAMTGDIYEVANDAGKWKIILKTYETDSCYASNVSDDTYVKILNGNAHEEIVVEEVDEVDEENTYGDVDYTDSATNIDISQTDENYDDEYLLPDIATRLYMDEELSSLSKEELKLARNEVFARHGRRFKDSSLQSYFDSKSWYIGYIEPDDFDDSVLNAYEKYNLDLILQIEQQ